MQKESSIRVRLAARLGAALVSPPAFREGHLEVAERLCREMGNAHLAVMCADAQGAGETLQVNTIIYCLDYLSER